MAYVVHIGLLFLDDFSVNLRAHMAFVLFRWDFKLLLRLWV
jgi:hypothetical protein